MTLDGRMPGAASRVELLCASLRMAAAALEVDAGDGAAAGEALRALAALRRLVLPLAVMKETLVGAAVHRLARSRAPGVASAAVAVFAVLQADVRAAAKASGESLDGVLASEAMSMLDAKQGDLDAEMAAWEANGRAGEQRLVAAKQRVRAASAGGAAEAAASAASADVAAVAAASADVSAVAAASTDVAAIAAASKGLGHF